MKRRPPSARACSLRGKTLTKTKSERAGKLLAECAATPKRSKRMTRKSGATKTACRRRGLALKSGKVGNSNISKVAVRLGECRAPAKKRAAVRSNPSGITLSGYPMFKDNRAYVGAVGEFHDAHGKKIGTAVVTSRWKTPKSYVSDEMFQIEVTTPDGVYTGRGAGSMMLWNGRRVSEKVRRNPSSEVSAEERAALRAFASRNGRTWKAALRQKWAYDPNLSGPLRALRNRLGPRWLASFTLSR